MENQVLLVKPTVIPTTVNFQEYSQPRERDSYNLKTGTSLNLLECRCLSISALSNLPNLLYWNHRFTHWFKLQLQCTKSSSSSSDSSSFLLSVLGTLFLFQLQKQVNMNWWMIPTLLVENYHLKICHFLLNNSTQWLLQCRKRREHKRLTRCFPHQNQGPQSQIVTLQFLNHGEQTATEGAKRTRNDYEGKYNTHWFFNWNKVVTKKMEIMQIKILTLLSRSYLSQFQNFQTFHIINYSTTYPIADPC